MEETKKKKIGRPKKPKTEPTFAEKRKGEIAKIEEAETKIKKMYVDYYMQQATEKFEEYKNGRN